jgi:RNA polymerase sigma-70 factor (ECF subfamily)
LFCNKQKQYFIDCPFFCQEFLLNRDLHRLYHDKKLVLGDNFSDFCNIFACGAIMFVTMVGAMAEIVKQTETDELVLKAGSVADALGQLYDLYYDRIFRFCVHRLFNRDIAEEITSSIFLTVAGSIRNFNGQNEADFRNWLYAIAVNHTNSYIRKTSRRKKLLAEAAASVGISETDSAGDSAEPDWPMLYKAVLRLKPKHQTIVTLRFFENMDFEQIGQIINARPATVRVTLHRILKQLRNYLQTILDGEK